jgi:hypothetical protein
MGAGYFQRRALKFLTFKCGDSVNASDAIDISEASTFLFCTPDDWSSCTVTIYTLRPSTDTYVPLYDFNGTAMTFAAIAARATQMSTVLFQCHSVKFVTNNSANNAKICSGIGKG